MNEDTLDSFAEILRYAMSQASSPKSQITYGNFDSSRHVLLGEIPIPAQHLLDACSYIYMNIEREQQMLSEKNDHAYSRKVFTLRKRLELLYEMVTEILVDEYPTIRDKTGIAILNNWQVAYINETDADSPKLRIVKISLSEILDDLFERQTPLSGTTKH